MVKKNPTDAVENALANLDEDRRGFLKTILLGSAAVAAMPVITSVMLGQDAPPNTPRPDGGQGKGKGGDTDPGKGNEPPPGTPPGTPPGQPPGAPPGTPPRP